MVRRVAEEPVYDIDTEAGPRRRGRKVTFLLTLFALVLLAFGVVRVLNLEDGAFLVGAMAVTPYAIAGCFLLAVLGLLARRWVLGLLVLVMALALSALLAPRYFAEEQPAADGPRLRVLSANLFVGRGDAELIVDLVREQEVDVLVLLELTPAAVSALDAAGLAEALPHRVFDERPGGAGSGIAAAVPLRRVALVEDSTLSQPSAVVDLPGNNDDVELTAVHVQPPLSRNSVGTWRDELAGLPHATPDRRVRILAGDFNATLDHADFIDLVSRGYADAAEETGEGLSPTWASWPTGPPLTIDHILVDAQCAISSYAVFDVPGSDHNAVLAEVVLP